MKLVIGTRASRLALIQTQWVADALRRQNPAVEVEIKTITTKGDRIQDLPLDQIGGQGIFTRAIVAALRSGEIDLAVHSLKDMPSAMEEGLDLACVPAREDPRDALVTRPGIASLEELPMGAKIGCGSKRRICQLLAIRPDLEIRPIRGNVDTRLSRIERDGLDGTILAVSGLKRLGWEGRICYPFSPDEMIPACGQGALGLQIRADDRAVKAALAPLEDPLATRQAAAERAFLAAAGGSCHLPVGAYCRVEEGRSTLLGMLGTEDGPLWVEGRESAPAGEEAALGRRLGEQLKAQLAQRLRETDR
ncbi:hydroxymethylbilane synthase [Bittarella massiliensis (ex Durand et al. 2017)]|uniref:hydroxymethylbilane synthase n=1 Tax=Bittarella massiliensis (ex Durand et al. 2017) TaxID=1720313 RepID=UPI00073ECCA2|nr:hydroxymethylbilane synthase [Bittarella massiliensis (ex Durand et al. 2017)]